MWEWNSKKKAFKTPPPKGPPMGHVSWAPLSREPLEPPGLTAGLSRVPGQPGPVPPPGRERFRPEGAERRRGAEPALPAPPWPRGCSCGRRGRCWPGPGGAPGSAPRSAPRRPPKRSGGSGRTWSCSGCRRLRSGGERRRGWAGIGEGLS